jgi:hypothetical protein
MVSVREAIAICTHHAEGLVNPKVRGLKKEVAWAQNEMLRDRFEGMAVYAEYCVYGHSDTKPC